MKRRKRNQRRSSFYGGEQQAYKEVGVKIGISKDELEYSSAGPPKIVATRLNYS
jgi:hypothetical protein